MQSSERGGGPLATTSPDIKFIVQSLAHKIEYSLYPAAIMLLGDIRHNVHVI